MDQRRLIDSTRITIAVGYPTGRGTGLGKVEAKTWTLKKLRLKLADPLIDVNVTFAKYQKLKKIASDLDHPKHRQANDQVQAMKISAGNWTAARYEGKSRKVSDIRAKTMLVLDIDHANPDQVFDIRNGLTRVSEFYWMGHTSRSHCPEKPKFRLVLPVSREMTPDEANAALRLISTYLLDDPEESIEIVDGVTFRPNQTMFWPSASKGQEFWFEENLTGDILDVDEFLGRHPGWEDYLNLPYRMDEQKHGLKDPNQKMEDPTQKPEPIGAFCRVYNVEDAIDTFLPDVYTRSPNASDVRYNYSAGTANNGVVVYDDGLFVYSMHYSDPASGMHNAFDMVRLHLFGHLDEDQRADTLPSNQRSYKAMVELCRKDEKVAVEEMSKFGEMLDDLEDEDDDAETADSEHDDEDVSQKPGDLSDQLDDLPDEDDDDEIDRLLGEEKPKKDKKEKADRAWTKHLLAKANGALEPVQNNINLICENDPRIKGAIGYNEFTHSPVCLKQIKSKHINTPSAVFQKRDEELGRKWADAEDTSIINICSANAQRGGYETDFPESKIKHAVISAGMTQPIHPVKTFIEQQHARYVAEGRPEGYLETLMVEFLGVPPTPFHLEACRKFLVGAVARIYEPGCKADAMLIVEGPTGSRKSTFGAVLFGGFYAELSCDLNDEGRLIDGLQGNWCVEMAEMKVAKAAGANTLKQVLSKQVDTFRRAYDRRPGDYPRQNVFYGTSNEDDYLTDPTSNRRYWVHRTETDEDNPIDTDRLQEELHLVWGPAYEEYLRMREKQPRGMLNLDLENPAARRERDIIANGSRKESPGEIIAEHIMNWLNKPVDGDDIEDADGLPMEEYQGQGPMVRNLVTAADAFNALSGQRALAAFRQANVNTYGKAMKMIPGLIYLGRCRKHDVRAQWYCRTKGDDRPWIPVEEARIEDDEDDMLD